MPLIRYKHWKPQADARGMVDLVTMVVDEYTAAGYTMTIRQIYYQFVARDLFPDDRRYSQRGKRWVKDPKGTKNAPPNYEWMINIVTRGRMAGLIDWDAFEDRTRELETKLRLNNPLHAVETIRDQYGLDMWENQDVRVQVWIEKEALAGVVEDVCTRYDVPYFSCRGYMSLSSIWRMGRSMRPKQSIKTIILHLGDHDPSGVDMTRDNRDRLQTFARDRWQDYHNVEVRRIALNMDQIRQYDPPPNPTKFTDSRAEEYIREHGYESWELDALEPAVINDLIEKHINEYREPEAWRERADQLASDLAVFDDIVARLEDDDDDL